MSAKQLFILKKEMVGAELPCLIKLNREKSRLEIFRKCGNEKLYDHLSIRRTFVSEAYTIFEKEFSFPCIFGGEKSPTPMGLFHIEAKSTKEYISPFYPGYNQVKFFGYLVIFEDYFIHSDLYAEEELEPILNKTISLKDKATSGCIRVSQKNLLWLIENVDIGTPVFL